MSQTTTTTPTVSRPTARQLRALRGLAEATGTTFAVPRTRREASALIASMQRRRRSSRSEIARERSEVRDGLTHHCGGAIRVRCSETAGFGSSATWRRG